MATALFIWFGALSNWAGWLGLAVAVADWVGLIGLGIAGRRAARVTAAALGEVRSAAFPVPTEPTAPTWGRWWRVTRAIPFRSRAVRVTRNIDYWGDGNRRHRLDVYQSRLAPPGKAPVMVYIHGGAWMIGEKREQGKPMMYELVARGWVCVAINYRLSPKATWPDHIVDAKRAVAWVKEHIDEYGGDPSFVAVSGGSAGGHLCALLALSAGDPTFQPGFEESDTSVQACVPFYGVMDLTSSPEGSAIFGPGLVKMLEKTVMKTTESEHPDLFRAASPATGSAPRRPRSSCSRGSTTPWFRWRRRACSWSVCGRCRANRWPMRSCPWPSTLLTCWPPCAARPPPRPWQTSSWQPGPRSGRRKVRPCRPPESCPTWSQLPNCDSGTPQGMADAAQSAYL